MSKTKQNLMNNEQYFTCFCKKYTDNTRNLVLKGRDLIIMKGKQLEDSDIEFLLIFLKQNQDIVSLNLAYNQITCIGFKNLITYLLIYKNIYKLNVQNNNIMEAGIDYMCEIGQNLHIKSLQLSGNKFGVESSKKIALLLLKNPYLEYLDIAEVDQTISSLIYFTTVMRLDQPIYNETLKILDISRPNPGCMYFFNAEQFATLIGHMLRNNTCLFGLHLQKCGFNCHDIECMTMNAQYNYTLHFLDLACNNIGDYGMHHLANWLIKSSALCGLILSKNIITDHGARILSHTIPFSKLKFLDISFNKITDDGMVNILNSLKKISLIKSLRIFGNFLSHITAKTIKRILLSKVLYQTNLDVKPYRVEDKWYCAQYPMDYSKEHFYDMIESSTKYNNKAETFSNIYKFNETSKMKKRL
ncbi:leucine-rich repeat-containing protein 34-like isoform X2 [Vespa mandarinia]|uniref:leucine-rich repeat-containing protein 34-like isoform X2 n=2 Tax=Vespa mandarinia TaxID=7446 RepID=UPI0016173C0C|nr:leucine-rich repeat-containing protein 34-like isoform X2 [Vespa mandarinia]